MTGKGYSFRWYVEGVFAVLKRLFGEHITVKKCVNMAKEIGIKAEL